VTEMANAAKTYGRPVQVDPTEGLLGELYRTQGIVLWLGEQVQSNLPDELADAFWTYRRSTEVPTSAKEQLTAQGVAAYAGVWLDLYLKERAHLLKVTATCIQLNLMERRQQLDEAKAEVFAHMVTSLARRLGHDPDDPKVREVLYTTMAEAGALYQRQLSSGT
jgi:hypothetical protein